MYVFVFLQPNSASAAPPGFYPTCRALIIVREKHIGRYIDKQIIREAEEKRKAWTSCKDMNLSPPLMGGGVYTANCPVGKLAVKQEGGFNENINLGSAN